MKLIIKVNIKQGYIVKSDSKGENQVIITILKESINEC